MIAAPEGCMTDVPAPTDAELPPVEIARSGRARRAGILLGISIATTLAVIWIFRAPIVTGFVDRELAKRGVEARYDIDQIGLGTQRLKSLEIGSTAAPDLTAREIEIDIALRWNGPALGEIRADGVRLNGVFKDGKVSFGELDKFSDPASTEPLALPDIAVRLTDARFRIASPWGALGGQLDGSGNLANGFAGKLALAAPRTKVAGCTGQGGRYYGDVSTRDGAPTLKGLLGIAAVTCDTWETEWRAPQANINVTLARDFARWTGDARLATDRLSVAGTGLASANGTVQFDGTSAQTVITADLSGTDFARQDISAQRVRANGRFVVGNASPTGEGQLYLTGASLPASVRDSFLNYAKSLASTPLSPLADQMLRAASRAAADFNATSGFALTGSGTTQRLDLIAPTLTATSGAALDARAPSRLALLLGGESLGILAQGDWRLSGGGLPDARFTLNRKADASFTGQIAMQPYTANGATLALAPATITGGRDGTIRFATLATLSGSLGDGRIERGQIPINGSISPFGAVALNSGCTAIGVDALSVSGFRFGANRIALCSTPGQPLLAFAGGRLNGGGSIGATRITGTSGQSPLLLGAGGGRFDLATTGFSLTDVLVRLGASDAQTRFAARSITGGPSATGLAGRLDGAEAEIANVPLLLRDIQGDWRSKGAAIDLTGALSLLDAAELPRFQPLRSSGAKLRFADGKISAQAAFSEAETGTAIGSAAIVHTLSSGTGHADLDVPGLTFTDKFQPEQLTRLALGVIANVAGTVRGAGRIDWSPAGVTSGGQFGTDDIDLAAAFGPVKDLSGDIAFNDLLNVSTAPGQLVLLGEVNPGIAVLNGNVRYQMLPGNRVRIEGGRWPVAGGELILQPTIMDFSADNPRNLMFEVYGVDAAKFLQEFGFSNISATGVFDGLLPMIFDQDGGRIVGGQLVARDGGGEIAYVGELSTRDLGTMANMAFGALKALKYDSLVIGLNGDIAGEMVTDVRFAGISQGQGTTQNFLTRQIAKLPFIFNVKISAPFRQLISSAQGFYDPSLLVQQNLGALLREDEEAAKRDADEKSGAIPPVQPTESETKP